MADRDYTIGVCREGELRPALELALSSLPPGHRGPLVESLANLRNEPLGAFTALVVARKKEKIIAAAWAQPQPGRTAALWLPEGKNQVPTAMASDLIAATARVTDAAGVSMTQALLEYEDPPCLGALRNAGYQRIAELLYLEWLPTVLTAPQPVPLPPGIAFVAYQTNQQKRLEKLLTETYHDTLDCPTLEGMRNMADVVAGYKLTGVHDPAIWFFLQQNEQDAGVLLLGEHPDTQQMELVYMGLTPAARGQRLGALAIRYAQSLAKQRLATRMVLAVDAENAPAMRLYTEAGFREWARRIVYVRQAPTS